MLKKLQPYLPFVLAFLGGGILPLAFSPFDIGILSIVSIIILLGAIANHSPRKGFVVGFCYGLGMFGVGVSWVYVSIHDHGNASAFLAGCLTALFVLVLSLFPALLVAILNKRFPNNSPTRLLLAFPALWVLFEMIRGWLLTGFPWLYVGYTQMSSGLRAYAPVGGVFLVSWMTVLVASQLFCILEYYYKSKENNKQRNGLFISLFAVWAIAFGFHQIQWTVADNKSLGVALVQGNIPQLMRWDNEYVQQILATYERLTSDALKHASQIDLIVWPEAAIPLPLSMAKAFFDKIGAKLLENKVGLIAGVPIELPDGNHFYNSVIGIGGVQGVYDKRHLVPFGEYVPLEGVLRGVIDFFNLPMSSIVPGPSNQPPLIVQGYRFAPAICYEIAYPNYVQKMSQNADFILTVSNDAWFGRSIGPAQHLQMAQFRALETGKYLVRATNTGFTAIITPQGFLQDLAPEFEEAVLIGNITPMIGQTAWTRFGIWPVLLLLVVILFTSFCLQRKTP